MIIQYKNIFGEDKQIELDIKIMDIDKDYMQTSCLETVTKMAVVRYNRKTLKFPLSENLTCRLKEKEIVQGMWQDIALFIDRYFGLSV